MSIQPKNTSDAASDDQIQVIESPEPSFTQEPSFTAEPEKDVSSDAVKKEEENLGNDTVNVQEEQPPQTPQRPRSSSLNATTFLESTIDNIAVTFSSRLNPFAKKLGKSIDQVRQYTQEKFGTAEDITVLPNEYLELEKKVDSLQRIHENFLKVTKTFKSPYYDYPVPIQESLADLSNTVTTQIQQLTNKSGSAQTSAPPSEGHPKTLSHAISRVASSGAQEIGKEIPFGTALEKFGEATDQVGEARITMDHEIVSKFNTPLQVSLKTTIEGVNKARRVVQQKRLALDAAKTAYRETPDYSLDEARKDVEQAEDEFVGAVEQSTTAMKALLQDPEPFRDLVDFAKAQLAFFQQGQQVYSALVPELEEIQVTQESLYRDIQN